MQCKNVCIFCSGGWHLSNVGQRYTQSSEILNEVWIKFELNIIKSLNLGKNEFNIRVWHNRGDQCDALMKARFHDLPKSHQKAVEQIMWKSVFYFVIEVFRQELAEFDDEHIRQHLLAVIDSVSGNKIMNLCMNIHKCGRIIVHNMPCWLTSSNMFIISYYVLWAQANCLYAHIFVIIFFLFYSSLL